MRPGEDTKKICSLGNAIWTGSYNRSNRGFKPATVGKITILASIDCAAMFVGACSGAASKAATQRLCLVGRSGALEFSQTSV